MSGQREVTTVMLPVRHARPVPFDDVEGALAEIERVCQVWGGGEPLLPIAGGALPAPCWKWTTSKPQASVLA